MKLHKISLWLLAFTVIFSFAACSDDDDYQRATIEGQQVYFSNELSDEIDVDKEQNSVVVTLRRISKEGALTVDLKTTCDNSVWQVPSSVTFQDKDTVADLVITYDPDAINYGEFDSIRIEIADASYTTPYGPSYFEGVIGAPEPWTEPDTYNQEGTCTYVYTVLGGEDAGLPFTTRTNTITGMQQFLIDNWCYGVTLVLDYDPSTGEVSVDPQYIGYDYDGNDPVYITDFKTFYAMYGKETDEIGSFDPETGIISIPVYYYCNAGTFGHDYEYIYLDGFTRTDGSVSVTYAGRFFDTKENPYICGNVTLGADVTKAYVALVPAEQIADEAQQEAVLAQIAAGEYSPLQEVTASGEVRFDASELADGTYYLIAVSFIEDEEQEVASAKVTYTASAEKETFADLYKGTYTYTLFFGSEDEPATDEGLVLSQSEQDSNKYKISHWGYDVDFIFSFNEDGSITVPEQETGFEYSSYGMVMVSDYNTYVGSTNYPGSYDSETGTFTFCLVYYVDAGALAAGYETFQITDQAVKARVDAAQRKAMSKKGMKVTKKSVKRMPRQVNEIAPVFHLSK